MQNNRPCLRIVTTRAPGMIPCLIREIQAAERPVVLVPESFTLACETEIVNRSAEHGIFDLPIFSPSSLIREIRELTGRGRRKAIPADGQNMMIARVLHHRKEDLKYYRDSVAQPALAHRIASQINDFTRARLTPGVLQSFEPSTRRAKAKVDDLALIWEEYQTLLGDSYEDVAGQWLSALDHLGDSGILKNARLVICGFDYITHDLLNLIRAAVSGGSSPDGIVICLISDSVGPDREIFRSADSSVQSLVNYLENHLSLPFSVEQETLSPVTDPGIAYVEKTLYATGAFTHAGNRENAAADLDRTEIPDLARVRAYYAKNSSLECQHACQTLIEWHRKGIPWEDMAVAVCDQDTLPSLLPLTLSAAGIPFNAKQDRPILMSGYAQYFLSLLRILRLNFCKNDVLRLLKTGFSGLAKEDVLDMENYVRKHGVHRNRWLRPFHIPEAGNEKDTAERMEALRQQITEPILALRQQLSEKNCTGKQAAELLFRFVTERGVYDRLLAQEEVFAREGDDLGIDRNRQVWTAVNGLLDSLAVFVGDEPLPMRDLCNMLEASLASKSIKSLPQLSHAVTVAPPQMFFSSGVPCMIVMGLQETEAPSGGGILSENERIQLERFLAETRPFSRIGQSVQELAARRKQDIYQAVSLAREQLVISCSGAKPNGGILTRSTAFRRLYDLLAEQKPENISGGLTDTDIRPFAPSFALETIAVRLREEKGRADSFLRGTSQEDILWQDALAALYRSEQWKEKTRGVLDGLHLTAVPGRIPRDQAARLYQGRALSISRIESFSSCPWKHMLQYGLDLFPSADFRFGSNEQGSFNHDVIRLFLNEAMKQPEWPDLSERQQNLILNRALALRAKDWEGGILRSDILHRYQGHAMIRGLRTSVTQMMRAFRQPDHFLPEAVEVPFGMADADAPIRLPALPIRLSDGSEIGFSGRIDRIDRLSTPDGKTYFMIIDHKMSSRDVRQNSLISGLQLQLPLYIRAAGNGLENWEPAGGVYQPVRNVIAEKEGEEALLAQTEKDLRSSGVILDDPRILKAIAPVRTSKKSETNDTISTVSGETLQNVQDCSVSVIAAQTERIFSGAAERDPLQDGEHSPCEYCDHADACTFDGTLPGCRIRALDHKHRLDLAEPAGIR